MASDRAIDDEVEGDGEITLEMLHAVERDERLSQRGLASSLNIALGLTNAYLKRCIGRGLVKVKKIPPNRYRYYLTPAGFSEKTRLTARYLTSSFSFYRRARNQCDELMQEAADAGIKRLALIGSGELTEIALLCALQFELEVVAVVDEEARANRFRHAALVRSLESAGPVDAVLICDLQRPQAIYEKLSRTLPAERILTPLLLKVGLDTQTGVDRPESTS
mgnify:CR=1 FL=1|tara:strand:- start:155 stop:817 length:663 start_codon:yes stop_codon:yes gene_type:complete